MVEHSAPGYHVFVGKDNIGESELTLPCGSKNVIKIVPATIGNGGNGRPGRPGVFQTILGAVLVVAGSYIPGAQGLVPVGISMLVGGVAQLLTPLPESLAPREDPANKPNFLFSGPVNTYSQGHSVSLCYGRLRVGSAVISASVVTNQMSMGGLEDPSTANKWSVPVYGNYALSGDLVSINYARLLDLVSEGPIVGLKNGMRSVYLDGTQLQNNDGTYNFSRVASLTRLGTQDQSYIPGFTSQEAQTAVSTKVTYSTPVVRTISGSYDAVNIVVSTPVMRSVNAQNVEVGSTVEFKLQMQNNSGGYVDCYTDSFIGKCNNKYARSYRVKLPSPGPWDFKLIRLTADASPPTYNDLYFENYSTIIEEKFNFPNSALVGISFDASQFQTVPTRGYDIEGLVVKVPQNYDPRTRTYTGVWDGQFVPAWTDNPAWILYDLITNERYGLGKHITASQVDKWGLYTIAQYCDVFVPTGKSKRATVTTGAITLTTNLEQVATTSVSMDVDASSNTFTRASGSFLTNGWRVGDVVTIEGSANVRTNGTYLVTDVEALVLTIDGPLETDETGIELTLMGPERQQYTRASGSFITDGFEVGDEVVISGLENAQNNGRGVITYVEATILEVGEEKEITAEEHSGTIQTQDFTEPRFTCNLYLQTQNEAYSVLNTLASVFRGMIYWASGSVYAAQDSPADAVALFTESNVVDGLFNYSGSSLSARHTAAYVTWNNPDNGYSQEVEYVEDAEGLLQYGFCETKITAAGCTSRSQAQRIGLWTLYSERLETEMVSFRTGLEGVVIRPGQLINLQDVSRSQVRYSGRVVTGTTTTVQLDTPITIEAGHQYTLWVTLEADGIQSGDVVNDPGTYYTLEIDDETPLPSAPTAQSVWVLESNIYPVSTWRVLSVAEVEPNIFEVSALAHVTEKFDAIEAAVFDPGMTDIPTYNYATVQNLTATQVDYGDSQYGVSVDWDFDISQPVYSFRVKWRYDDGNWSEPIWSMGATQWMLYDATPGVYEVAVAPRYVNDFIGPEKTVSCTVTAS
jgi:predicted phage tail protein